MLEQCEAHYRPWEVRRLTMRELYRLLDPGRYDPNKPSPRADAVGWMAGVVWHARRRAMSAEQLLEHYRGKEERSY